MITLQVQNSMTRALVENGTELASIRKALAYTDPNAEHMKKRRGGRWSTNKSFFNGKTHLFLTGFLPRISWTLKQMGIHFRVQDMRPRPAMTRDMSATLDGISFDYPYDYQPEAIDKWFSHGRGIIKFPTGAGKTESCALAIAQANLQTLFITHKVDLLYQTAKRFADRLPRKHSRLVGVIGNGNYEPSMITVATVQTLDSLIKRHPSVATELLDGIQFFIADEAHRSGSKSFYRPALLCQNAFYRMALTATPFMKGNERDDMYLEGCFGPIVAKVSNLELIERGIMARPFFRFFTVNEDKNIASLRSWRDIYERGIVLNEQRNLLILRQVREMVKMGRKLLIIVTEVKHGQIIEDLCIKAGITCQFVAGKDSYAARKKALDKLAKGKLQAVCATNIFDEGIDVKELDAIILAAGTKSAPALFQRTGRAVRKKEENNYALIVDFIDRQHPKLLEHSMRRYNLVKNEKGFVIL